MKILLDLSFEPWVKLLKTRQHVGKMEVYDPVRRKYIHLNQEELVRQAIIRFMMDVKGIPRTRMAVEKQFLVNGLKKRFDLLIFDHNAMPFMIVEVKAFSVKLAQITMDQAGWYNFELRAPYLLISNGVQSFVYEIDFPNNTAKMLNELPL
ncbi:MAG TPA: type I restriction enzyme HsdR N-terminal domain-containing protein [Saprospiraceae bacterium]|nr:type I restriction enzyme HsdR N-terminal domain-containing protein [Saprospiraceae bacterium]